MRFLVHCQRTQMQSKEANLLSEESI